MTDEEYMADWHNDPDGVWNKKVAAQHAEIEMLTAQVVDSRAIMQHIHDRAKELAMNERTTSTFHALMITTIVEPARDWLEGHQASDNQNPGGQ